MKLLRKIFFNTTVSKILLKPLLKLHSIVYRLIKITSQQANNCTHPKHRILNYKQWFLDNIDADSVVIDIGTSTGTVPRALRSKARKIYGIENDIKKFEPTNKQNNDPKIEYIFADATTFDYANIEPADYATLSNVLEHIDDRVGFLKKLISNINWHNKKRFLIRVPMLDRDWIPVLKKELGMDYRLDSTHFTEFTLDSFKDELQQAGLTVTSHQVKFGELYAVCEAN